MKPRQWYRIENLADDPSVVDIYVYDSIGQSWWSDEAVTAKQFIKDLQTLSDSVKTIRVHVNSPGGDVFEAVAITNALRAQREEKGRTVDMSVEGLAASAASFLLQAGNTIRIADNALVMVHNPWSIAIGDAQEMLHAAAMLEKVRDTIIATYQWHSPLSVDELKVLMDAETWMTAAEAVEQGFATEVVEGLRAAASIDRRAVATLKVPQQFKAQVEAFLAPLPAQEEQPKAAAPTEVLRLCREAGCLDLAEDLIAAGVTAETVTARIQAETETRAAASARETEIRAVCEKAGLSALADGYVRGAMTVQDVRAHLTTITGMVDRQITIDGALPPEAGHQKAVINVTAVYAERNQLRLAAKKE